MTTTHEVTFHIDGSSLGNPGDAGVGVVISQGDHTLKNISAYIGRQTNNVAEYTALIYALEEAQAMEARQIRVFTDSELLHRQMTGRYKVKNEAIKVLFGQAARLKDAFETCTLEHIPREQNKGADKLARLGAKNGAPHKQKQGILPAEHVNG